MIAGGLEALTAANGDVTDAVFRRMMDALPVAIYATDPEGHVTYFNPAAAKLSGRTPELGTDKWCVTWKLFLPDGSPLPHDQCPMAVALKGGDVPSGIECIAERPDGTRFWFTPYPAIVRGTEGQVIAGINVLLDITGRKAAEIEAKDQFRAIVETTPECVKILAADGTLLFMNRPGLEMVGASSSEAVTGKNVYDLIAPEHRERFREFNEKVCRGERAWLEFDMVGLTGVRCHMDTHAAPLRHVDGSTVQLAITRDITEPKRALHAALLLKAIVDSSDDAIISKGLDGIITSWNKGAERLFGFTAAEAIGQPVAALLIPEDRQDEEPKILARLRKGERVDHFETVRHRKDGALFEVSLTVSPVKDAEGRIIGASKIARDISESKRIHAALVSSEAKFRQLANSMPQIVWTANPGGQVDYCNDPWHEFTGLRQADFGDANWDSVLHPDDVKRRREAWHAALAAGSPHNIEVRFWDRHESRWRWFVGRALPVYDETGNIVKWFGSYTDIDDQKSVQEDLRRANENLEQFAFSASHDLQEPLRSVKIYSELLAKRYGETLDGEALKFVRYLRNGASRMEALIRDLLTYTQVTRPQKLGEVTDANRALRFALANLTDAIAEAGAVIEAAPLPSLPVHEMHLQQLFQNLVGNAVKYRSADRPAIVRLAAERQNGQWTFAVSDNGIGIDPNYKENIFGLFKRLHSSDEYSGTGIGLAICQRIVDQYQGRIWVDSEPGRGSTFRFTLPA
jgi:PAS domain S-box-containing protein